MATIGKDKNGLKRILFVAPDGKRPTIRLGKCTIKQAETFKLKLEALIAGNYSGIDAETARWIAALPDNIHSKLAAVSLVEERTPTVNQTLGTFLENYLKSRTDLKPNSHIVYNHTKRVLIDYFGANKSLKDITENDASLWRAYLTEQGLSEATVNKRAANAKVFFKVAVKRKLIESNPFTELESKSIANKSRQYFIERKVANKILDNCPDAEWKLIFSLCRYGGLRCPSEVLRLRWEDINWEQGRMLVHSPKTERHEGRESRIVPIFPQILPHLQTVFDNAEAGTKFVINRYRRDNQNLRTQLQRILKKAGVKSWPRLFQNLRASRETELATEYPLHIATSWIGNTARIAERHYLQIPDTFYEQAIKAAHIPAQYEAELPAMNCIEKKADIDKNANTEPIPLIASKCKSMQDLPMETKGIEQTAFSPTKTPFSQNTGTESGTVDSDFISKLLHKYPAITSQIEASNLPENIKYDLISLLQESERNSNVK